MDILSLVILAVLGLLITVTIVAIAYNIVRNLRMGERFRLDLAHKVGDLRLSRMTKAMGIDMGAYLHKQPVVAIATQMQQCKTCSGQDICDDRLAAGAKIARPEFCPNETALIRLRDGDAASPVTGGHAVPA